MQFCLFLSLHCKRMFLARSLQARICTVLGNFRDLGLPLPFLLLLRRPFQDPCNPTLCFSHFSCCVSRTGWGLRPATPAWDNSPPWQLLRTAGGLGLLWFQAGDGSSGIPEAKLAERKTKANWDLFRSSLSSHPHPPRLFLISLALPHPRLPR